MKIVTLDDVALSIVDGPFGSNLKTSDYVESGVPVLQGKNITGDTFVWKEVRYITEEKAKGLQRSSAVVGDHLLIKIGSIGYSAILDDLSGHDFAIIPANLARIRPNKEIIDDRYLHHWLKSEGTKRHFQSIASKTAQPALSLKKIRATAIPLPPLEEQKRIAGILDQADALRRLRARALDKLNTLGQAIFHEMFQGSISPATISELLEKEVLLLHKDGNHGSNYPRKEEFGTEGVPFLSAKAISEDGDLLDSEIEYLNTEKAKKLKIGWIREGDVLLSHNASVGKVGRYQGEFGDALIGTSLTCYRPNPLKLKSGFLKFALRSYAFQAQLRSNMSQTTRNQVPITAQKSLTLTIPSLAEQEAFEERVKRISLAMERSKKSKCWCEELFSSLQHRAFRGYL